MISIEELSHRVKLGPGEEFDYSDDNNWTPQKLDDYEVPDFYIVISSAKGSKTRVFKMLSKILTFVEIVQKKRFKEGCTIMPIPTTSNEYRSIWPGIKSVSNAVDYMIKIGLIREHNETFRFNAYLKEENKGKTYKYFYENEKKLLEYCKENSITKFLPKNKKNIIPNKKALEQKLFKTSEVLFGNNLKLYKTSGLNRPEFEDFLLFCLYQNYPHLNLVQTKSDEMNEKFYEKYPEFSIRFKPTFRWNKDMEFVEGIGIRATNAFCNKKDKNSDERQQILKEYGFTLKKDIRSSVPRLTLSINSRKWIDEDIDIYELINEKFEPGSSFNDERREAIKNFHMSSYFDSGSDKKLGQHVWYRMNKDGLNKVDVDEAIGRLRRAVVEAEGGRTFGSVIFYVESCIYLMTLYDLLCNGILTWLVYDCFYSAAFEDEEYFDYMIKSSIKANFDDFIKHEKF